MWNQDISGTSAPAPADVTGLASALRADFAAVEAQFALQDDPDGSIAQNLMTLVYGSTASDFFFGLLNSTFTTSVPYSAPPGQPALPAAGHRRLGRPAQLQRPEQAAQLRRRPRLRRADRDRRRHHRRHDRQRGQRRGGPRRVLHPGVDGQHLPGRRAGHRHRSGAGDRRGQQRHRDELHRGHGPRARRHEQPVPDQQRPAPARRRRQPGGGQPAGGRPVLRQPTRNCSRCTPPTSPRPTRCRPSGQTLLDSFLPAAAAAKRKQEQALAAITSAAGTDPGFATALLQDPAILHADADPTQPAVTDLTAIEAQGLSAEFFLGNDPAAAPDQVIDAVATSCPTPPPTATRCRPGQGGGADRRIWSGYLTVPQDGYYDICGGRRPGRGDHAGDRRRAGDLQQAGGLWQNQGPISLVAGALAGITLTATSIRTTCR